MVDWNKVGSPGTRLGLGAAVLLVLGAAGGAGAVKATRPSAEMAPVLPVAIASLPSRDGLVTVKGKVAEVYGDRFTVIDGSGKTMVDAGRDGAAMTAGAGHGAGPLRQWPAARVRSWSTATARSTRSGRTAVRRVGRVVLVAPVVRADRMVPVGGVPADQAMTAAAAPADGLRAGSTGRGSRRLAAVRRRADAGTGRNAYAERSGGAALMR